MANLQSSQVHTERGANRSHCILSIRPDSSFCRAKGWADEDGIGVQRVCPCAPHYSGSSAAALLAALPLIYCCLFSSTWLLSLLYVCGGVVCGDSGGVCGDGDGGLIRSMSDADRQRRNRRLGRTSGDVLERGRRKSLRRKSKDAETVLESVIAGWQEWVEVRNRLWARCRCGGDPASPRRFSSALCSRWSGVRSLLRLQQARSPCSQI